VVFATSLRHIRGVHPVWQTALLVILAGCVPARESPRGGIPTPVESVLVVPVRSDSKVEPLGSSTVDAAAHDARGPEEASAAFTAFTSELAMAVIAAKRATEATSLTAARSHLERVVACLAAPATVVARNVPCPNLDTVVRSLTADLEDAGAAISPQADREIALDAARNGMAAKDVSKARKYAAIAHARLALLHALAEADEFGMLGLLRVRSDGGLN
jgi:hypothetical protein